MYGRALPKSLGIQRERSALSNEYYIHITHSDARFYNSTKVGFPIEVKNTLGHLKHRLHLYLKGGLRRDRGLTIFWNFFLQNLIWFWRDWFSRIPDFDWKLSNQIQTCLISWQTLLVHPQQHAKFQIIISNRPYTYLLELSDCFNPKHIDILYNKPIQVHVCEHFFSKFCCILVKSLKILNVYVHAGRITRNWNTHSRKYFSDSNVF